MQEKWRAEAEYALAQILQNPVMFREFINQDDPNWQELEPHERAWTSSRAPYLVMCCGRGVRKTTTVIEMLYYWAINSMFIPGDPGLLLFVPNKAQKDAIFPRIRSACTTHWLVSKIVDQNKINVAEGRIEFFNGFTFVLRIAGTEGKESNVISIHGSRLWIDEAQDFPWRAWQSLDNVLKFDIPGHMKWVSGVPNGERRENPLYVTDVEDDGFISYNIGQPQMSWWTPELEYTRRRRYQALQEDSEDYKHYVLGQHGVPTYSIFDRIRFKQESYEVHLLPVSQNLFDSTKKIDNEGKVHYSLAEVIDCPPLESYHGVKPKIGLGWDVGYSPDPSVFFIMYQDIRTGEWRNLSRITLQRVEYPLQRQTLLWLDKIYNFDFIGIDMGGIGKVLYQELSSELAEPEYRERNYAERLFPVEFGANMVVALKTEKGEVIEKKDNVKRIAVETVSRWVQQDHRFVFSKEDTSLMDELERTKFTRTQSGEPVYKTEDDHQFAAMMCAIMAYENKFGMPLGNPKEEIKPKLVTAHWLEPIGA